MAARRAADHFPEVKILATGSSTLGASARFRDTKVYGFDTGFVCAHRGWTDLRNDDLGRLWEHYVLNEILARTQSAAVRYWRDKQGHEVDFVWAPRGGPLSAVECKWSARDFDPKNLLAFGRLYAKARLWVVATDAQPAFRREYGGRTVEFLSLAEAIGRLTTTGHTPPS